MFKFICSALHILKISRTGGQADFVYKHLTQKNFIFLSSTSWYVPPKSTYIHIPSIQTFLLSYLHCLSTLFRLFLLTYLWDPITTSIYFYLGFYTVLYYMSAQQNQNMNGSFRIIHPELYTQSRYQIYRLVIIIFAIRYNILHLIRQLNITQTMILSYHKILYIHYFMELYIGAYNVCKYALVYVYLYICLQI